MSHYQLFSFDEVLWKVSPIPAAGGQRLNFLIHCLIKSSRMPGIHLLMGSGGNWRSINPDLFIQTIRERKQTAHSPTRGGARLLTVGRGRKRLSPCVQVRARVQPGDASVPRWRQRRPQTHRPSFTSKKSSFLLRLQAGGRGDADGLLEPRGRVPLNVLTFTQSHRGAF